MLEERQDVPEAGQTPAAAHASGHPSPKEYVRIGVILAVLTAIEVAVAYTDVSRDPDPDPVPPGDREVRARRVVVHASQVRRPRYARFFVIGLSGAAILYLVVLISFRAFS